MTLDQAIEHSKEIASEQEKLVEMVLKDPKFENDPEGRAHTINHCKQCEQDHLQLATWLTELKKYRDTIDAFKLKGDIDNDTVVQLIDELAECTGE